MTSERNLHGSLMGEEQWHLTVNICVIVSITW
jgi:hypothetical protein